MPPAPVEARLPLSRFVDVPPPVVVPLPPVVPDSLALGEGLGSAEGLGSVVGLGEGEPDPSPRPGSSEPSPGTTSTANWVMASPTDAATVYVPVPSPAVRSGAAALPAASVLTRTAWSSPPKRGASSLPSSTRNSTSVPAGAVLPDLTTMARSASANSCPCSACCSSPPATLTA